MACLYWMILVEDVTPQKWWASNYNSNQTAKEMLLRHQAQVYIIRLALAVGPASFNRDGWITDTAVAPLQLKMSLQRCVWGCSTGAEQGAAGGHHILLGQFPHPLGTGSHSLPTNLWRRMEQVPFAFKLRFHTTSLAGFQKAAQYWGKKKGSGCRRKKEIKKRPCACCCITLTHPLTHS